jgi:hypothetical protein
MPRHALRALASFALALGALGCGAHGDARDVDVATRAASEFLDALDANDAGGAWRELASPLRERVSEAQWPAQIAQMRAPLGRPVARELASAAYAEQLVDAPPGQYFMVEFESQFTDARCGERVVAMFEHGGWRVAGYFIRNTHPRGAAPSAP